MTTQQERQTRPHSFTDTRGRVITFAVAYGLDGEADLIATNFRRDVPKADEWITKEHGQ